MKKILACIVCCLFLVPCVAFAGWENTTWGMSLAEVEKKLGVPLTKIDGKPNQYGLLQFYYNGQNAGLVCTIPNTGLERVGVALVGEKPCAQEYIRLLETHAKPDSKTEDAGKLTTAAWNTENTRIDFLWGKKLRWQYFFHVFRNIFPFEAALI